MYINLIYLTVQLQHILLDYLLQIMVHGVEVHNIQQDGQLLVLKVLLVLMHNLLVQMMNLHYIIIVVVTQEWVV